MSMGARVLICSRCWPRLSRWLGFKRSFWRPSTSWDTWTFLYFKNEHLKKADILRHKFWHEMTLADKKIWYCPLNPGPTACVPSNEWDWRINTKQVKCGSKQDHKLVLSRPSIGRQLSFSSAKHRQTTALVPNCLQCGAKIEAESDFCSNWARNDYPLLAVRGVILPLKWMKVQNKI